MTKKIKLTQGKVALVDDEDFGRVSCNRWYANWAGKSFYAVRGMTTGNKRTALLLHRFILNPPRTMEVDHINGDGLDCRKANMRICTHAENMRNSTVQSNNKCGFKGVYFDASKGCWVAEISHNRKRIRLGRFKTSHEAALAYDVKAKELHGKFARLNFG